MTMHFVFLNVMLLNCVIVKFVWMTFRFVQSVLVCYGTVSQMPLS